jgi:hypothetical protein
MSSAVAELDAYLQSMLNLKPPGVSGSKITSITSLCTANVQVGLPVDSVPSNVVTDSFLLPQSESVLIQKIYTHFKKAPGTHKLGVLYVVDSVTRQWVDQARKIGQLPGSGAPDGTFAAGVTRVTELLPVLMNDIINSAPEDQKVSLATHTQTSKAAVHLAVMSTDVQDGPKNYPFLHLLQIVSLPSYYFLVRSCDSRIVNLSRPESKN